MEVLCTNCGYTGPTQKIVPGSNLVGCFLICLFVVPGLIYAVWQQINSGPGCPQCKRRDAVIPLNSPRAKQIISQR